MTPNTLIAIAIGVIAAAMVVLSQHGYGTRTKPPQDPPDGDPS